MVRSGFEAAGGRIMSVLIKNMRMPENCDVCIFSDWSNLHQTAACKICEYDPCFDDFSKAYLNERARFCPLVEVKTPHGELIDRQKLLEDNKHLEYPTDGKYRSDRAWSVGFNAGARHCNEHAVYAKTVIEAEGEP